LKTRLARLLFSCVLVYLVSIAGTVYNIQELMLAGTAAVVRINAPGKSRNHQHNGPMHGAQLLQGAVAAAAAATAKADQPPCHTPASNLRTV
jgi:hypothetical protein